MSVEIGQAADSVVASMTLKEKLNAMSGDMSGIKDYVELALHYNHAPLVAGATPRLGLEGIRFTDGPRGIVMYSSTAFPSSMARAATFDSALEERIGDAIGVEARTQGANLFAGVCINLLRHPAWGRAQETYGEDSHLLGEMGAALVRGTQRHVMACIKHFALNSMENSRFWVDVRVDEADLRDLYLPHFKRCIDEGAAAVMTAYNKVNGEWAGHHRHLIGDILKGEWGFEGFTMTDFLFGVRNAKKAVKGGQDLEMPAKLLFKWLPAYVRTDRVSINRIDDAVTRLVRTQLRFAERGEPDRYEPEVVAGPAHRALASEAAARSFVLLRNEPIIADGDDAPALPFSPETVRSIAVIGWLADQPNLGDLGSSRVRPPAVSTVLDGMMGAGRRHGVTIRYHDGKDIAAAARLAATCDATVLVAGATYRDEGEWIGTAGGDRTSLRLKRHDERLILAVGKANARSAVVLMGGSAFIVDPWVEQVPAVIMAWYAGMEGGDAVAELLFGEHGPEGRLPCTWPTSANRLPEFGRFRRRITYGPLFGYRMMEATGQTPQYWFGHGLSYTSLAWGEPVVEGIEPADDGQRSVTLAVDVTNDGTRSGVEVLQAYVPEVLGTHPDPLGTLRGFSRLEVAPAATERATVTVTIGPDAKVVRVGRSSDPASQVEVEVVEVKVEVEVDSI